MTGEFYFPEVIPPGVALLDYDGDRDLDVFVPQGRMLGKKALNTPEVLAQYASRWDADSETWHFLTGPAPDVQRVCRLFGVDFFPDEGLMNHSLHTAIIDREGNMVANIEGNQFTADQLADLTEAVLDSKSRIRR